MAIRSTIQASLEDSISRALDMSQVLPGMLSRAANRTGIAISEDDLALIAHAYVRAIEAGTPHLTMELDLPSTLGATEEVAQATIQALTDALLEGMDEETERLSVAISAAIPIAMREVATILSQEIGTNSLAHAKNLEAIQQERALEVERLWGPALQKLDFMRHLVLEWTFEASAIENGAFSSDNKRVALLRLAERTFEVVGEILTLARAGYADGALARWRSLHEVCVIAAFLAQRSDRCAVMYVSHSSIEEHGIWATEPSGADSRRRHSGQEHYLRDLKRRRTALLNSFGPAFLRDYGGTGGVARYLQTTGGRGRPRGRAPRIQAGQQRRSWRGPGCPDESDGRDASRTEVQPASVLRLRRRGQFKRPFLVDAGGATVH
jgi:hypothetical protein